MNGLSIFSLNVNGLRNVQKRKTFFRKFRENSYDVICLQESYITRDDAEQWKKEWGGDLIFSEGTRRSKGQIILLNKRFSHDWNVEYVSDRLLIIKVKIQSTTYSICNVYAPNAVRDVEHFFNDVTDVFSELETDKMVICGDFNSVLDNDLDIISGQKHSDTAVQNFRNFCISNNLSDIFRLFHTDEKVFTWSRIINGSLVARRLDYILSNDHAINDIIECNTVSFSQTDHCGIFIKSKCSDITRGPGYWKFNNALLKENDYLVKINHLIDAFDTDQDNASLPPDLKWELLKQKIKEETINFSKCRSIRIKNKNFDLQIKLDNLNKKLANSPTNQNIIRERENVLFQLELQEKEKTKSAYIRSKEKWIEEGDKNSKFFLNLEKIKANSKLMPRLELDDGTFLTDQFEILEAQKNYFRNLYNPPVNVLNMDEEIDTFLNGAEVPTLDINEKNSCEGLVTLEELGTALKGLNNGSSPGLDGLTAEFYKVFWGKLGSFLLESFNTSYANGQLSFSQTSAIITLLHKGKDLSRTKLANWRPISLTNTDYKILAKSLALRLSSVIQSIVEEDQTGYISGNRSISNNLRLIDDVIEYLKYKQKPGILLALDFQKAYDSISKTFMMSAFKKFGFGQEFIKWVSVLMKGNRSQVGYNGWISEDFELFSGIRQGCPFSSLAFVIGIELLAIKIRKSEDIKGIKIDNLFNDNTEKIIKTILYADDVSLFLKNREDLRIVFNLLDNFKHISNLLVNRHKSEAMWLGLNIYNAPAGFGIRWVSEVKILGVYFSNKIAASCIKKNWEFRIQIAKNIIAQWERRNLSIFGKICIIKTFLASQFIYIMKALVVPDNILKEINTLLFRFLWRKRDCNKKAYEKVKRKVMINEIDKGGLNMIDVKIMQHSFQCEWLIKLSKSDLSCKWSWIPRYFMSVLGTNFQFLNSNVGIKSFKGLDLIANDFWKKCLTVWLTHNIINSKMLGTSENLWNNKRIKFQDKPLYYKEWASKGINKVKDILTGNNVLTYNDIGYKIGNFPALILQYNVVSNTVASLIRNNPGFIHENDDNDINFNDKRVTTSQGFKTILNEAVFQAPCSEKFWFTRYRITLDTTYWLIAHNATKESRLRELHWKLLHNIYPTNILLSKLQITNNNKCKFCPNEIDFIEHFFFLCPMISKIWKKVEETVLYKYGIKIKINESEALLGIPEKERLSKLLINKVNHHILIAKMCIGKYKYGNPVDIICMFENEVNLRKLS